MRPLRLAALAFVSVACTASTASAATQVIPGSLPNMTIYVGDEGALQAKLPNQTQGMFFGDDLGPAEAGFYLRLLEDGGATTYDSLAGSFEPVSNGPVTGNFTPTSPAEVQTTYTAGPDGQPKLRVKQTTLYVGYQKRFSVIYEVTNVSQTGPVRFIAGTAADLYIGGDDSGIGSFIDGDTRFVGGTNAASLKAGGLQEVVLSKKPGESPPVAVPRWASYQEGGYSAMTDRLRNFDSFENQILTSAVDNGVGVSWDDHATTALQFNQTARYEVSWVAERPTPFTASPTQATVELPGRHQVVLTLIDENFNPVPGLPVRYRVGGVNATNANPDVYARAVTNESGQVVVNIQGTTPGADTVFAWADVLGAENGVQESAEPAASAKVTWLEDNRIAGAPTVPGTLSSPNGSSLTVGTTANPDNAEAPTFTFGRSATAAAGFEACTFDGRAGNRLNLPVGVELQPGGGTIGSAELLIVDRAQHDPNATSGATAPPVIAGTNAGNRYTFPVECVTNSDLWVRFTITEGGDTQTFVIPIGGLLLIDPQGVVYDRVAFDAAKANGKTDDEARAASAITGATVRLQRRNSTGAYTNVISGDPAIRPNVNPQVTGANGLFQWDVQEGNYRVLVTAPGFVDVTSRAVDVPPPVLDLHIPMERPAAPVAPVVTQPTTPPAAVVPPAVVPPAVVPGVTPKTSLVSSFVKALLAKAKAKVKVSRTGVLSLGTVSCAKTAQVCSAPTVTLRAVSRGKGKKKLPAVLVTKKFAAPKPGKSTKLTLTLSKSVRTLVRARKSVAITATVSGAGKKATVRKLTLVRG